MAEKKKTRKEKKEINKKMWREMSQESRELIREEKQIIITSLIHDDELEWQDKFLEGVKAGLNIAEAVKACGKYHDFVYKEFDDNPEFKTAYARARDIANDKRAEQIVEMHSKEPRTIYDAQQNEVYDKTDIMWRKAREDSMKWLLAVRDPAKFGNNARLQAELTGKDGAALGATIVVSEQELLEAKRKLEEVE